jgi:hypothetical protein
MVLRMLILIAVMAATVIQTTLMAPISPGARRDSCAACWPSGTMGLWWA